MSIIRGIMTKATKKISIAIIGLKDSGKTSFVRKLVLSEVFLQATVANKKELELYTIGNLSIVAWDLYNTIPIEDILWKRSIIGANSLLFFIDSSDSTKLNLNRNLLYQLINLYSPNKLLIIASKCDLPNSLTINELLDALDLVELDKTKCTCDLFKSSSITGEGMYTVGEWIHKLLFNYKESVVNYTEIKAAIYLRLNSDVIIEEIFIDNPNFLLLSAFRELRRKARFFSQTMRFNRSGEEVIDFANYKGILVKEENDVVCFLIGYNKPIPRTIEIAKKILQQISYYNYQLVDIGKLIGDLYPLDLPLQH